MNEVTTKKKRGDGVGVMRHCPVEVLFVGCSKMQEEMRYFCEAHLLFFRWKAPRTRPNLRQSLKPSMMPS